MPLGKVLSFQERAIIDAYQDAQNSLFEKLQKEINKSSTCVYNYLKLGINYEKNHYSEGNRKLTRCDHSRIFKEIMNNNRTGAQVKTDLQLPVTIRKNSRRMEGCHIFG